MIGSKTIPRPALTRLRTKLLKRRRALIQSSADLSRIYGRNPSTDSGERGSPGDLMDFSPDVLSYEVDVTLAEGGLVELEQIDVALARIEAGTYGSCEECGLPIALKRLVVVPHTSMCVACKSLEEAA